MAQYLAGVLGTVCVPEYARYYCKNLNRQYTLQDEVNMFYGQLALEDALLPLAQNQLLICDTTILTVKIWCDHLFATTPKEVSQEIQDRPYDFYLLLDIDLPWEDDPLRDFPEQREHFMQVWRKELDALGASYQVISGVDEARFVAGLVALREALG